ncbi:MAG: hypothetical protein ACTSRA_20400 [Promethearchaeota archaeon]
MRYGILLGLLLGLVSAMFLPFVFMMITMGAESWQLLNNAFIELGNGNLAGLVVLFSQSFLEVPDHWSGNFIGLFTNDNNVTNWIGVLLTWIVCSILSGLFMQSAKKGIIAGIIFVIVEILIYLLMATLAGQAIMDILNPGGDFVQGFLVSFMGVAIITPFIGGIGGSLIGGLLSSLIFGPEKI